MLEWNVVAVVQLVVVGAAIVGVVIFVRRRNRSNQR